MKSSKTPSLSDRLGAAAKAKQAALERFRAQPASDDPAMVEKRAARQALAAARELRADERRAQALRDEETAKAAAAAARETEIREREARQLREGEEQVALEAERKIARDMRYAARKARKA
jgi:hypothetical protein